MELLCQSTKLASGSLPLQIQNCHLESGLTSVPEGDEASYSKVLCKLYIPTNNRPQQATRLVLLGLIELNNSIKYSQQQAAY